MDCLAKVPSSAVPLKSAGNLAGHISGSTDRFALVLH